MNSSGAKKDDRRTLRIDPPLFDTITEEQERLRRAEGKRPSQTNLLSRMWTAYSAESGSHVSDPKLTPSNPEEHRLVAALLLAMRNSQSWTYYGGPIKALLEVELKKVAKAK